MRPTLLKIFGMEFHSYNTLLSVAFVVGTILIVREANRQKPMIPITTHGGIWAFIGALLGAKVFWILQYDEPKNLLHALYIWQGGLVYYGGLIGAVLALIIYFRIAKLPYFRTGDVAIAFLPMGQAITRLGCFLNGCCWGRVAPEAVSEVILDQSVSV